VLRNAHEAPELVLPAQNKTMRRKKALSISANDCSTKMIDVKANRKGLPLPTDPRPSFERALAHS
jgi:hypothetical protein